MRPSTLLLSAFLGFLPQVLSSGSFELQLKSFTNELGRLAAGSCCEGPSGSTDSLCTAPCRTRFRVCLKIYQANIDTTSPCTFGDVTTPVLGDNSVNMAGAVAEGFVNPITFPFDFTWPGTFSLIVEAWHDSNETSRSDDSLIARMTKQAWLEVGGAWRDEEKRWTGRVLRLAYRVTCSPHYYGNGCKILCRPRDDSFGHYTCSASGERVCLAGWTGDYCTIPRCLPGCHSEHGHCSKPDECICSSGWVGRLCDECERYPGCMHGSCQKPWDCLCDEGWGGLFCNQDLNYCTNHRPCRNGGTCFNTGQGSYTCSCPAGFAGADCESRADACPLRPCLNGGVCDRDDDGGHSCVCPDGWTGARCEVRARTCAEGPCKHGGTCEPHPHGYTCTCPPGRTGVDCENESDPCASSPCEHGGSCFREGDGYSCSCPAGYTGARCEVDIDECADSPCTRGSTCINLVDAYKCRCAPGYVGAKCETRVDLCLTKPCANGGQCSVLDNDYECTCRPGFAGKDCSIDVDECVSAPCANGGTCRDRVDGFSCTCLDAWTGRTCSNRAGVESVLSNEERAAGGLSRRVAEEGEGDDGLSGRQVAAIAALSAAVPALALLAAIVLACVKRSRRRRRAAADAEARAQNERNAHGSRVIKNSWGKCANNDPAECQNAHNASMAEERSAQHKTLNTESAARLMAALDPHRRLSLMSHDSYCNASDTSLVKRALDTSGSAGGCGGSVFVLDDHRLPAPSPTFATQV